MRTLPRKTITIQFDIELYENPGPGFNRNTLEEFEYDLGCLTRELPNYFAGKVATTKVEIQDSAS